MSQRLNLESPMGIALCWTFMTLAILFEVSGTTCLKLSDGFTRLLPSCLTFFFYALSLVCLNFALKKIDVGVFGRQRASPTTILASFAVQIVTFGVCALILLWSLSLHQHHGSTWPATLIFLALAAIAIAVYIWVLRRMDRIALKRRETLVLELCRS